MRWLRSTEAVHVTAVSRRGAPDLLGAERARWLWEALRRAFPDALACVLMPDHVHLVLPARRKESPAHRLAATLAHYTRQFRPGGRLWRPVPAPAPARGRKIVARLVRYVFLNPCRAGYAADPLVWLWSTFRDVVGATLEPWGGPRQLAGWLPWSREDLPLALHDYVVGHEAVPHRDALGPVLDRPPAEVRLGVRTVLRAVAVAARASPDAVRRDRALRRLVSQVAWAQGGRDTAELAQLLGCSVRTVQRDVRAPLDARTREVVLLCALDPRLRAAAPQGSGRGGTSWLPPAW